MFDILLIFHTYLQANMLVITLFVCKSHGPHPYDLRLAILFILKAYAPTQRPPLQKLWTSFRWSQNSYYFHFGGLCSNAETLFKKAMDLIQMTSDWKLFSFRRLVEQGATGDEVVFLVDLASYRFSIVFAPLKSDNTATILSWKLSCCITSIKINAWWLNRFWSETAEAGNCATSCKA